MRVQIKETLKEYSFFNKTNKYNVVIVLLTKIFVQLKNDCLYIFIVFTNENISEVYGFMK